MERRVQVLLVASAVLAMPCLAIPAKLDALQARSPIGNQLSAYNYDPPAVPSGLYELPGPPVPPIIPPRPTTRRTTTTTTPPPPPPGLYGPPDPDRSAGPTNLNPNFISLPSPVEPPRIDPVRPKPTPATAPTPRDFQPAPTPMMKKMDGPYMPYDIAWGVQDPENGNMFSHSEQSGGDDVTGEYRVMLPDGRMQIVSFYASPETGYQAKVEYQ